MFRVFELLHVIHAIDEDRYYLLYDFVLFIFLVVNLRCNLLSNKILNIHRFIFISTEDLVSTSKKILILMANGLHLPSHPIQSHKS